MRTDPSPSRGAGRGRDVPAGPTRPRSPHPPLWAYRFARGARLVVRTRQELEAAVVARALRDAHFRRALLARPKAALEESLGTPLPPELDVRAVEETEAALYVVLPGNPYEGVAESDLVDRAGMTYDDVARDVLRDRRGAPLGGSAGAALVARAWRDADFARALVDDPVATIERAFGDALRERLAGRTVEVLVETAELIHLVVPRLAPVAGTVRTLDEWAESALSPQELRVACSCFQSTYNFTDYQSQSCPTNFPCPTRVVR